MKQVIEKDDKLHIKFFSKDKKEFYEILNNVKALPGREYKAAEKVWIVPKELFLMI